MNILITGSSGFLGRHLSDFLEQKGHNVTKLNSSNVDLTNQQSCENIPKINYDQIYHLAAWTRAGDFCEHHQGDQWIINQLININILNWWKNNCPTAKMIAFGTSASYAPEFELKEEFYMSGSPIDKFYSYAMSKRMLLAGLKSLNKQFGMEFLYLIPSTLYGPNYHTDERQKHFIFDIIYKIILGKQINKDVVLWGDGFQKRELVYINDFVEILYDINKISSNDIYNIGAGFDFTIRDIVKILCDNIEYDPINIKYDINNYVGLRSKVLDISKISKKINFKQTSIQEGVIKTIEWINSSQFNRI
jgi:GDP-L-fucose synthase